MMELLAGSLAGLNRASWGAFKDSPYEEFYLIKYIRSIVIGGIIGYFLGYWYKLSLVEIYLVSLSLDTIVIELYKLFFRSESQKKYLIPSMIHIWNKPVKDGRARRVVGVLLCISVIAFLQWSMKVEWQRTLTMGLVVGFIAGTMEAMGGMWKDAPFEGFEKLKFFRSPLAGAFMGFLLYTIPNTLGGFIFMVAGADRGAIEFYKSFIMYSRPGKFRHKTFQFQKWAKDRWKFGIGYAISLLGLIYFFMM